eukprot:CAMPEP_0170753780 /NCGR_PEP_ID=MMETSP0437-20130122/12668_1 /TAXON_ID=0 /ORGANISM="Sexangularia sp." /LENGTH=485 /DNA_ID=CAMNT_0011092907 /DNA_START=291 /DNA_END=1748 /DNA_ORIENTATION=-
MSSPSTPTKNRRRLSFTRKTASTVSQDSESGADDVDDVVARVASLAVEFGEEGDEELVVDVPFNPWQYADGGEVAKDGSGDGDEVDGTGDMEADRKGLLRRLRDMTGMDLTRIPIPVYYNEPVSFLHRIAECLQYHELLAQAGEESDSLRRLLLVTVFSITPYSSAERTTKPFNPILGETYEWTTPSTRFVAEQVSHHPPIAAASMQAKTYEFGQYKPLEGNFTGNAVVSPPMGRTWVSFPDTQDIFEWGGLTSCVHNILVGRLWVDHYGEYEVANRRTGERAEVSFTQCGWFSRGWHEVSATISDARGKAVYKVEGRWNEQLTYYKVRDGPSSAKVIWTKDTTPASGPWGVAFKGFSRHGQEVNELTELRQHTLPASDSRWRPDCRALGRLNYRKAGRAKHTLEERQREERRMREARNDPWVPRHFALVPSASPGVVDDWLFTNKYWEEREARLASADVSDPVTPTVSDFSGLSKAGTTYEAEE